MVLFTFLIVILLSLNCNEQNSLLLDNEKLSSPSLSGDSSALAESEVVFKRTQKFGNGPEVVSYVKPVPWDGGPVKPGTLYQFKSPEEALSAYADDPQMLEFIARAKEDGSRKEKSSQAPGLASDGWIADAAVFPNITRGGYQGYWIQGITYTESPAFNPDSIKNVRHKHYFYWSTSSYIYEDDLAELGWTGWYSSGYSKWLRCAEEMEVYAEVWKMDSGYNWWIMASDGEYDYCDY